MASQGPNAPGTTANDTGVGTKPWANPGNSTSSDNIYSTITTLTIGFPITTNYLKVTNFGFSIPSGATIDGIVVEFERKSSFLTGSFYYKDSTISLSKGGTISGNNKADTITSWSTTEGFFSYGSSSDLWGLSWTDTDINASTFGVAISILGNRGGKNNVTASVDFIRITVYYTAGGGGGPTNTSALLMCGN